MSLKTRIENFWQRKSLLMYLLVPLSWIFQLITVIRYYWYVVIKKPHPFSIPVIVVGNISLGGTGKTPLVSWLAAFLQQQGFTVGIVMRGHGARFNGKVKLISLSDNAFEVGDEALLLAKKTQVPVVIGKKRPQAVEFLLEQYPAINIVISDDGLQHYALSRDIEIAVIDGTRRFGNGYCLPAGPLRERQKRLNKVDFIIAKEKALDHEWQMSIKLSQYAYQVNNPQHTCELNTFIEQPIHAIAGIGNPALFFTQLKALGLNVISHPFNDHYQYQLKDLQFNDNYPILMTEKDAVKCQDFPLNNIWAVPLEIDLPLELGAKILWRIHNGQKTIRHFGLPDLQTTAYLSEGQK